MHDVGLASSHFARHYSGNHSLFSLPQGTEMFHFPWFALAALWIQAGVTQLFAALGFPIRTSPDQRLVGNSPKLFAATHVLHRLLAPRHPPHALSSLLALISCPTPASRRIVETRNQGPGPCSSLAGPEDFLSCCFSLLLLVWETSLSPPPAASRRQVRLISKSALLLRTSLSRNCNLPFVCTCQRTSLLESR